MKSAGDGQGLYSYMTTVTDINRSGQYVGYRSDRDQALRAYTGDENTTRELALLKPGDRYQEQSGTAALSINDAGKIVGWVDGVGFERSQVECRGGVWEGEKLTRLDPPDKTRFCVATGINNKDQIVGYAGSSQRPLDAILPPFEHAEAYLWHDDKVTKLGGLDGAAFSRATDVNDDGSVVGESYIGDGDPASHHAPGVWRPWHWRDGKMTELGTLGDGPVRVHAINSGGQIVGRSAAKRVDIGNACLWHAGKLCDLNDTISPEQKKRWRLVDARHINAGGQILALGWLNGSEFRVVLLQPER